MSPANPAIDPALIRSADGAIGLDNLYALALTSRFIYAPTGETWPKETVNTILPMVQLPVKRNGRWITIKPSAWLSRFQRVEQMTWAPGEPMLIRDRLISAGGWRDHPGACCFNLHLPPILTLGDAAQAARWIKHLNLLYPDDGEHIADFMAQRIQRPGEKINHALLLGGPPGIGKDLLLAPLRAAVGLGNFIDISPANLFEAFTPFVKAVVVRMNEAHDLGEAERSNRYALYERVKIYAAAPPEVLRCNEKFLPAYYVSNVLGLVITTNHKSDGVYLPSEDRRHFIAWSHRTKEEFTAEYFSELWKWLLEEGGVAHVAAWLAQRDLSAFNPKAPPRQTEAFFDIVNASRSPEDADLADALDELKRPDVCSLIMLATTKSAAALEWLLDRRYRRAFPHRMERCGYATCRNPNSDDGLWSINGRRQALYVKADFDPRERQRAASDYILKATKTAGTS